MVLNTNTDILFLTNRQDNDHTRSNLEENFNFHNRSMTCSEKVSESSNYKVIIIDQFFNDLNSVNYLPNIREGNEEANIYLLTSREFTATEDEIINTHKISIFSLPISEVELFNRIIV